MAYTLIQGSNNTNGASPVTLSFTNTPAAGNLMLCSVVNQSNTTVPTVSDTNGNWTLLNSVAHSTTAVLCLFGKIAVTAQPRAITVTQSTSNIFLSLYEFSGNIASIASVLDRAATANTATAGTSTSGSQPSLTTTNPNDLLFTQMGWPSIITAPVAVTSGGAAMVAGQSASTGSIKLSDAYAVETTTGTFNPYWTWTGSHSWSQLTTALLPAPTSGFFNFM
jgi:hypothetical protein